MSDNYSTVASAALADVFAQLESSPKFSTLPRYKDQFDCLQRIIPLTPTSSGLPLWCSSLVCHKHSKRARQNAYSQVIARMAKKLGVNSDTTNLKKLREEYTTLDTPPKKSKPSLNELLLEVDVAVAVTELTEYAFAMKNFAAVRGII